MGEKILSCNDDYASCPCCSINQAWEWEGYDHYNGCRGYYTRCKFCKQIHIFYENKLVYPHITTHIKPHILFTQYPKSQILFNESLAVASNSPRAGLTLSRMCLECLVREILVGLEETPKEKFLSNIEKLLELEIINNKIKKLLDDTRVIGNKSIHNFNLIDSENEVTLDDCMVIWKATNYILESLKMAQDLDSQVPNLLGKLKEK